MMRIWPLATASAIALLVCDARAASDRSGPPSDAAAPLRIVMVGHSPVDKLRDMLEPLVMLCRKQVGLPESPGAMPSNAALASVASIETEALYDGPRYAQYKTSATLLPDSRDGCKVKVLRQFSVELETSCDRWWSGSAGARSFEVQPLRSEEDIYRQDAALARTERCQARLPMAADTAAALRKTSRQPAGQGVQCQWSNEFGLHVSEAISGVLPKHADPLSGTCFYADLPEYPYTTYRGERRKVPVMFRMARLPGDSYRPPGISLGVLDQRLKEFSAGSSIPAGRFGRAQAESFLKQPAIVPLEEPKP